MVLNDIAYASGFVALERERLLNKERIRRMIIAKNLDIIASVLFECGYDIEPSKRSDIDFEPVLKKELERTAQFVLHYCTDDALKTTLKTLCDLLLHSPLDELADNNTNNDSALHGRSGDLDFFELSDDFDLRIPKLSFEFDDERSASHAELLEEIYKSAKKIKSGSIRQYFAHRCDITNILTAAKIRRSGAKVQFEDYFLRGGLLDFESVNAIIDAPLNQIAREFLSCEYAQIMDSLCEALQKRDSLQVVEGRFEVFLLQKACYGQQNMFSDEPLFAYFVQKLEDFKTIRLVIRSKRYSMGENEPTNTLENVYDD